MAFAKDVIIPDAALRSAVYDALGKPQNTRISVEEAKTLPFLSANNKGINSLEGLQYFTGLNGLALEGNNISDISPLASLTGLNHLNLHANRIKNLSPLANLKHLKYLLLSNNKISSNKASNVSVLSGLTALSEISLGANPGITDLTPLLQNKGLLGKSKKVEIWGLAAVPSAQIEALKKKVTVCGP